MSGTRTNSKHLLLKAEPLTLIDDLHMVTRQPPTQFRAWKCPYSRNQQSLKACCLHKNNYSSCVYPTSDFQGIFFFHLMGNFNLSSDLGFEIICFCAFPTMNFLKPLWRCSQITGAGALHLLASILSWLYHTLIIRWRKQKISFSLPRILHMDYFTHIWASFRPFSNTDQSIPKLKIECLLFSLFHLWFWLIPRLPLSL